MQQSIAVLSKKQLKEVLCFLVDTEICKETLQCFTKYGKNNASHKSISVLFYVLFLCDLEKQKIEEAPKSGRKEIGTSASLAGRCCNADEGISKVGNKFANDMRCQCVYYSNRACYSLSLSAVNTKKKHSV